MFNYNEVLHEAKKYQGLSRFKPTDPHYKDIVAWANTLKDNYRLKMYTYMVINKSIQGDSKHNVIFEYYWGTKTIIVYLVSKDTNSCISIT